MLTNPLTAQLELTDKCNLRCKHCYHLDTDELPPSNDVEDETLLSLADKLGKIRIFTAVITGGEPLLRKNALRSVASLLKSYDMEVSLNTNALLLKDEDVDWLVKANIVDSMLISCCSTRSDIFREMTRGGNIRRLKRNFELLTAAGVYYQVNMVVTKDNVNLVRETAEELQRWGVTAFGATPAGLNAECPNIKSMLSKEEFDRVITDLFWVQDTLGMKIDLFEALPKCAFSKWVHERRPSFLNRMCQAGKTICSVGNNGDVRSCSHSPISSGNLIHEPMEEIWKRMGSWRSTEKLPAKCHDCKLLFRCNGGCRITAETITGDKCGQDPYMTEPITEVIEFPTKEIILTPDTLLGQTEVFRFRPEGDGYLVATKKYARNIKQVNKQLFDFLTFFRKQGTVTAGNLAPACGTTFGDIAFQGVLKQLLATEFILDKTEK